MTSPADLLADLRALERYAAAGGADDKLLARVIERLVLLALGFPPHRVGALLRVQTLRRSGVSVTTACRRAGLSRDAYYRALQILQHHLCEPRAIDLEEPRMARVVKTVNIKDAGDVRPPRGTAGKPSAPNIPAPRDGGRMSVGKTAGNFADASLELPVSTPAGAWDMESKS